MTDNDATIIELLTEIRDIQRDMYKNQKESIALYQQQIMQYQVRYSSNRQQAFAISAVLVVALFVFIHVLLRP